MYLSLSISFAPLVNLLLQGHLKIMLVIFMSIPYLLSSLFALTFVFIPFEVTEITSGLSSMSALRFLVMSSYFQLLKIIDREGDRKGRREILIHCLLNMP